MGSHRVLISVLAALTALVMVKAEARTLSGQVTYEATGLPIAGATVTAWSGLASYSDSQTTDEQGYYAIAGLPPSNDFIVSAVITGYSWEYYSEKTTSAEAIPVDLSRFDAGGIDFTLAVEPPPVPRTISGRVTLYGTNTGIAGLTLKAYSSFSRTYFSAQTDGQGYYTVTGLENNQYPALVFTAGTSYVNEIYNDVAYPGPDPQSWPEVTRLSWNGGNYQPLMQQTAENIDFALLNTPRTLSGRVTAQGTSTGVADAVVTIKSTSGAFTIELRTDVNGNYSLGNLLPIGDYTVSAAKQGYAVKWYPDAAAEDGATLIDMLSGNAANIDLSLPDAPRTLSGRVTIQGTSEGMAKADVTLKNIPGGITYNMQTDTDGYYAFDSLLALDDYTISAAKTGYVTEWYAEAASEGGATPINLVSENATDINLTLSVNPGPAPRFIRGRVVREGTTTGVAGVRVQGSSMTRNRGFALTDADGYYEIAGFTSADTSVYIVASSMFYLNEFYDNHPCPAEEWMNAHPAEAENWLMNNLSQFQTLNLSAGDAENINFTLILSQTISGRVKDADTGAPLQGVQVEASSPSATFSGVAITDADGYYVMRGLMPLADYTVQASRTDCTTEWFPEAATADGAQLIDVSAEEVSAVDFTLTVQPSAEGEGEGEGEGEPAVLPRTISGRIVFDGTNTGMPSVTVRAYSYGNKIAYEADTDADGYYTLAGLDSQDTMVIVYTASPYYMNEVYPNLLYQGMDLYTWSVNEPEEANQWFNDHLFQLTMLNLSAADAQNINFGLQGDRFIMLPARGARVFGNEVTVAARFFGAAIPGVASVSFEYKPATGGAWAPINTSSHTPNPDTAQPFFVYWDTTSLSAGDYQLRAIITEADQDQFADLPVTVTVDHATPDFTETRNGDGLHEIAATADPAAPEAIRLGGGDATTNIVADLVLPPAGLAESTAVRMIFPNTAQINKEYVAGLQGVQSADIFVQLALDSGQTAFLNGAEAILNIEYGDANQDGLVDKSATKEKELRVVSYDTELADWAPLAYTGIDAFSNLLHAKTTHFTTFGGLGMDRDKDGLADNQEDSNGNGVVDPGETDPLNPDSDDDGASDGIEVKWGSDPLDPLDTVHLPGPTGMVLILLSAILCLVATRYFHNTAKPWRT